MGTQYKVDTDALQVQIEALTTLLGEFPKEAFYQLASDADSGSTHDQINAAYATLQQTQTQLTALIEYTRDFFQTYLNAVLGNDDATVKVTPSGGVTRKETEVNADRLKDYSSGADVERGSLRYVYQNGTYTEKTKNGWGKYTSISGGQCNSACESMALSYLGIDRSPESLVPEGTDLGGLEVASYGTSQRRWTAPDGRTILVDNHSSFDKGGFDKAFNAFLADGNQGNTAPPMIRYTYPGGSGGHWLVVVGKNPDGSYNVVGPGLRSERLTTVTISNDGTITGNGICQGGGKLGRYAQYSVVGN